MRGLLPVAVSSLAGMSMLPVEAYYYTSIGGDHAFAFNWDSDYLRRWRNLFLGYRKVRQ